MPNWCQNSVEIRGSDSDLESIKIAVEKEASFLRGLFPQVDENGNPLQFIDDEGNVTDWDYNHWCSVYGTKWDDNLYSGSVEINSGTLSLNFETAWSPPCQGIETISTFWPNCVFGIAYAEPGCDFAGFDVYRDGVLVEEHMENYPDCGDWEEDPDGCCKRQSDFENGIFDAMVCSVAGYEMIVKVKQL